MGGFVARRVLRMVALLIVVSMLVFWLFSAAPADPAALTCGKSCSPEVIEANRERLGLDEPVYRQYLEFVGGIFTGRTYGSGSATFECDAPCLGYSFTRGEEVTPLIASRIVVTFQLALGALVLWMLIGVTSGVFAALRRGRWQDKLVTATAMFFYSFPSFFIALVLLYFVVIQWNWLPYPSYVPLTQDPLRWLQTMILPWLALALIYAGFYTRITRSQMLETLGEDFIRTARAKGLPEREVIRKHALRAGLTPIVSAAGVDFALVLGGAVIVESIFTLPGIGKLALDSVVTLDLPILAATVLVAAFFVVLMSTIVDLLYAVLDPRVRVTT
jgi:peptide/nickel transport system permease protein